MPVILFYSLPITIFLSIVINLSKLSAEYELIVLTSFGLSPIKILHSLIPIALLTSTALFTISFILIPIAEYTEKNFIAQKKQDAQFNIQPGEYGQKFGPWYIYVKSKDEHKYEDVVLFQTQENKDTFIIADESVITTKDRALELKLQEGSAFTVSDIINQIDFVEMSMSSYLKPVRKISSLSDLYEHWKAATKIKGDRRGLMKNIFISILPIISLFLYLALGYFNPRYQKNNNTMYALLIIVLYIVVMEKLSASKNLIALAILPTLWIAFSYYLYRRNIKTIY
jgi:lipopolysaccharide export system permease protein